MDGLSKANAVTSWRKIIPPACLLAMVIIAYLPTMLCGFVWDDREYVQHNKLLRSADGLRQIWFEFDATPQYYPLVFTTYWIEYGLWGLNPVGYHAVNVLLHAAVVVLLWRTLMTLGIPYAWMAAAIFALHPVHVESVAWITERKNVLSGVFYLGALWVYLRYALRPANDDRPGRAGWFYVVAMSLCAFALLSKTVTCTLPAVLLLLLWWKRKRIVGSDVRALVPMFAIGIGFGLLTIWVETTHVGAEGEQWDLSLLERCLLAGRVLWFYAAKLVWPAELTFIYLRWQIDASAWTQYMYPFGAVAAVAMLWLARRRMGTGPLVAVLYFAGTLFPVLGIFAVYFMRYSFVADHFQYLPSMGLIALVVASGGRLAARLGRWGGRIAAIIGAIVLMTFGTLTWRQIQVYESLESLWRDTIEKNPTAWIAHNNLGFLLQSREEYDEAIRHYHEALRYKPDDAEALNNLGSTLLHQGEFDQAIRHIQKALKIKPVNPAAHNNLGLVYQSQGKLDEAIRHYQQALKFDPDNIAALNNLGNVFRLQGRSDEAIRHYRLVLKSSPEFVVGHHNLGIVLASTGKLEEAAVSFRRALRLEPDFAPSHHHLAITCHRIGDIDCAVRHYRYAVHLMPDRPEVLHALAQLLATLPDVSRDDRKQAIQFARRAVELTGRQNPAVLDTMAVAYAAAGHLRRAVTTAREALTLATDQGKHPLVLTLRTRLNNYEKRLATGNSSPPEGTDRP